MLHASLTTLLRSTMFVVFMFLSLAISAQEKSKQINTVQKTNTAATNTATDTAYVVKSGKKYAIHTGARGGKYIIRVSAKSGKEYKQYLKD